MGISARDGQFLDTDVFLRTGQSEFGTAWRYELVRGTIIAHAAPSAEHGIIVSNLAFELNGPRSSPRQNCNTNGSGTRNDRTFKPSRACRKL
jgi:hypothetical protein